MDNIKEFTVDLERFNNELLHDEVLQFQKEMAILLLRKIVLRTPRRTGNLVGEWQVGLGVVPDQKTGATDYGRTQTITSGMSVINSLQCSLFKFIPIWIANNADYSEIIEYGGYVPKDPGPSKDKDVRRKGKILVKGGWNQQAPNGMVGISVNELSGVIKP